MPDKAQLIKQEIERWIKEKHFIFTEIPEVTETANHFANWQHDKDFDDLLQSEMKFPKEFYEKGRFDMREEMKKALIGGEVVKDIHNQLSVKSEPLNDAFRDIKFGDKLKIIIVKDD